MHSHSRPASSTRPILKLLTAACAGAWMVQAHALPVLDPSASNPHHESMTAMNTSPHKFTATQATAAALSVSREATLDQPPAVVWKLIGEFNALDIWLPPVQASTLRGAGTAPGAIRVLDLGGGASVTEELIDYDSARHRYTYAFVASPLPVKGYVATIGLGAAPDGRTVIQWHSTFEADGVPDEQAKAAIQGIYDVGLAKLVSIFGKASAAR